MSYNYCKDHRSGMTYVYEMEKIIDESSGKSRTARKLVGRLDENGNIVPTSGRRGRLPKKNDAGNTAEIDASGYMESLRKEVEDLKKTIAVLRRNQQDTIKGLEALLASVKNQAQN